MPWCAAWARQGRCAGALPSSPKECKRAAKNPQVGCACGWAARHLTHQRVLQACASQPHRCPHQRLCAGLVRAAQLPHGGRQRGHLRQLPLAVLMLPAAVLHSGAAGSWRAALWHRLAQLVKQLLQLQHGGGPRVCRAAVKRRQAAPMRPSCGALGRLGAAATCFGRHVRRSLLRKEPQESRSGVKVGAWTTWRRHGDVGVLLCMLCNTLVLRRGIQQAHSGGAAYAVFLAGCPHKSLNCIRLHAFHIATDFHDFQQAAMRALVSGHGIRAVAPQQRAPLRRHPIHRCPRRMVERAATDPDRDRVNAKGAAPPPPPLCRRRSAGLAAAAAAARPASSCPSPPVLSPSLFTLTVYPFRPAPPPPARSDGAGGGERACCGGADGRVSEPRRLACLPAVAVLYPAAAGCAPHHTRPSPVPTAGCRERRSSTPPCRASQVGGGAWQAGWGGSRRLGCACRECASLRQAVCGARRRGTLLLCCARCGRPLRTALPAKRQPADGQRSAAPVSIMARLLSTAPQRARRRRAAWRTWWARRWGAAWRSWTLPFLPPWMGTFGGPATKGPPTWQVGLGGAKEEGQWGCCEKTKGRWPGA